ncbi:MAG: hypothetical protein ACUVRV_03575 [Cyanobacteriota bacterium]
MRRLRVIAIGIPWFAYAETGVSWQVLPMQVLGVITLTLPNFCLFRLVL